MKKYLTLISAMVLSFSVFADCNQDLLSNGKRVHDNYNQCRENTNVQESDCMFGLMYDAKIVNTSYLKCLEESEKTEAAETEESVAPTQVAETLPAEPVEAVDADEEFIVTPTSVAKVKPEVKIEDDQVASTEKKAPLVTRIKDGAVNKWNAMKNYFAHEDDVK